MKAIIFSQYGSADVLRPTQMEKPIPKEHEVLIKIHATTVTPGDCVIRRGNPLIARIFSGLFKPKNPLLGHELAGQIESLGKNVTRFKTGDKVFGSTGFDSGTYAEYICLSEDSQLTLKPANIDYEQAASIPTGALTALYFLKRANINKGQKVLIYGASGSVGTYAIQLAKYFGAEVTGVCSTANVSLVKSLGADKVIDYTKEDFTKNSQKYHLIFDAVGKTGFSHSKNSLLENGVYASTALSIKLLIQALGSLFSKHQKVIVGIASEKKQALDFIKELVEAEEISPIIDRRYQLEQITDAHRYVEQGRKKGNAVVTIATINHAAALQC